MDRNNFKRWISQSLSRQEKVHTYVVVTEIKLRADENIEESCYYTVQVDRA